MDPGTALYDRKDPVLGIDRSDLDLLLSSDPKTLLGRIIALNRMPRYHNTLDAIRLMWRLTELRALDPSTDTRH